MKKVIAMASVVLVSLASQAPAYAETFNETPAEREASKRFDEGNVAYAKGQLEEARVKWVQAWSVLKRPGILYNLARVEQQLGRWVDSYVHHREFMKFPQTDPERTVQASGNLSELRNKVTLVEVKGAPSGTKILIDGEPAGETPLKDPLVVLPGPHEVRLRYGAEEKVEKTNCQTGKTVTVDVTFGAPSTTPPPPVGGTSDHASWAPTLILGGVGVAGLVVGGVTGALSASNDDELKVLSQTTPCTPQNPAACTALQDKASSASGLGTVSVIGYLGGGVFLGAAVVTALVMRPWEQKAKTTTTLHFIPSLGGGAVVGTF